MPSKANKASAKLILALLAAFTALILFCPLAAQARTALLPGLYQSQDATATCRLSAMPDGSMLVMLWQGGARQAGQRGGFSFNGRLIPGAAGRLAGTFQALPGTCCPVSGRIELQAAGADAFHLAYFAPDIVRPSWRLLPGLQFNRVAEPAPASPLQRLSGGWRMVYWYTDLLPGGANADTVSGNLALQINGDNLAGRWQGKPGALSITPSPEGAVLAYRDDKAGFSLEADLGEEAQGLALSGPFRSTLGAGRLMLVREGLPASPPGQATAEASALAGLWVNPLTGRDFYEITDSADGITFLAYGGNKKNPRYLTKGQAAPDSQGLLVGTAKDQPGYCCNKQGRISFQATESGNLEVRSFWWPQGQNDPGGPLGHLVVLKHVTDAKKQDKSGGHDGWPLVVAAQPGLLDKQAGALAVEFTWKPSGGSRNQTLFSQGGYGRDMDLYIDRNSRLSGTIATGQGMLSLDSDTVVTPNAPHTAWLLYEAGNEAKLVLDGQVVAEKDMDGHWNGSRSPYIIGASRWPGREFQGDIAKVSLWGSSQDYQEPQEAALVIEPQLGAADGQQSSRKTSRELITLVRLWNPRLMQHAYAVDQDQRETLEDDGFVVSGPVASLWKEPGEGLVQLWLHRYQAEGPFLITTEKASPPGYKAVWPLGYAKASPGDATVALLGLSGKFAAPLNQGPPKTDNLFTTLADEQSTLINAGYGRPNPVAHVRPAGEKTPHTPLPYTWAGSWQGDGWGRFFIKRSSSRLFMFWYYSTRQGPNYYGRYLLSPDGTTASGIAVGKPDGAHAAYYRHKLELLLESPDGPRIRLTSQRLAAPLDDGRLVKFKKPKTTVVELEKTSSKIPGKDLSSLLEGSEEFDPALMYERAVNQARDEDRLVER